MSRNLPRAASWLSLALVSVIALGLAGCAGIPLADSRAPLPTTLPRQAELRDVPFFAQEEYQCGPAALAMVLTHAGIARVPAELTEQVYLPQRKGSLQVEMLAAVRRAGLLAYALAPTPAAALQEVAAGHPVVVLLKQGFALFPRWHYAVLIGYDLARDEVMLHSGSERRSVMTLADFDRAWSGAQGWAIVAVAPDRIPASANEAAYVQAAVALERVAPEAARLAYAAALDQWPENLLARIGLGNAAYRRHELTQAEREYRRATLAHPDSADAWNNLAQVLSEQEHYPAALDAAAQALTIGGPRQTAYAATLASIRARMGP